MRYLSIDNWRSWKNFDVNLVWLQRNIEEKRRRVVAAREKNQKHTLKSGHGT